MARHCVEPKKLKDGITLSTGERHIVVRPLGSLELVTDTPFDERLLEDDGYELRSTDGKYSQTLNVLHDSTDKEGYSVLDFKLIPMTKNYTLTVNGEEGPLTLFTDVPYAQLENLSSSLDEDEHYKNAH